MADEIFTFIAESGGDYDSVVDWEADLGGATYPDLVSFDKTIYGLIIGSWTAAEGAITLNGWSTTDSTHKIVLEATGDARHDGKWKSTAWRCESTGRGISVGGNVRHVELYGLQVGYDSADGGDYGYYFNLNTGSSGFAKCYECIAKNNGGTSGLSGFYGYGNGSSFTFTIQNCLSIDAVSGNAIHIENCADPIVRHNTVITAGAVGIAFSTIASGGAAECNLVETSSGSCFTGLTSVATTDNNASSDATADDGGGYNNRINQTFTFVNAAGDDYHLAKSDLGALCRGKAISGITTDIDGDTPANISIGADDGLSVGSTITTYIQEDGGGDYDSAVDWEADLGGATGGDIVANDEAIVGVIQEAWTSAEALITLNGWTTGDMLRHVTLRTEGDARHTGQWTATAHRIEASGHALISANVPFVHLDGLQVTTSGSGSYVIYTYCTTKDCYLRLTGCISKGNGAGSRYGTYMLGGTSYLAEALARNCLSYDHGYGSDGTGFLFGAIDGSLENCTAYGNDKGVWYASANNGDVQNHCLNVLADSNGIDFQMYGRFTILDYCASSDATADDYGTLNNRISQNPTYVDEGARDLHLASSDTAARDYGMELSVWFTTDIDGETRSGSWDIGADEYQITYVPVGNTREVLADILAPIGNTREVLADISALIGNTREVLADILRDTGTNRLIKADILGLIGNQREVLADILGLTGNTVEILADIGGAIGNTREILADILGLTGNTREILADIAEPFTGIISRTLTIRANIAGARRITQVLPPLPFLRRETQKQERFMTVSQYPTLSSLSRETAVRFNQIAFVLGETAQGDREPLIFVYRPDSTQTHDGNRVIRPAHVSAAQAGRWELSGRI